MEYSNLLKENIQNSFLIKKNLIENKTILKNFDILLKKILKAYQKNGKIFIMGNGGSAADAIHFSAELVSKFKKKRKSINVECLNTNISTITSIANDFGYKYIFSKQLESSISKKDILFVISTSGNSLNVLEALKFAKNNNIFSFLLGGNKGGKANKLADISLIIPSSSTPLIQEVHIVIEHTIAEIIENNIDQ